MTSPTVRIIRLEEALARSRGCRVCRRWSPAALLRDDGAPERPERCPACGRVVPIETRVQVTGVSYDAI